MTNDANFHTGPFGDQVLKRNEREIALNALGLDDDFPNAYTLLAGYVKHFAGGHTDVEAIQNLKRALCEKILGYEEYLEIRGRKDRERRGVQGVTTGADETLEIILNKAPAEAVAKINQQVEKCNQLRVACLDAYNQFEAAIRAALADEVIKEKRDAFGNRALELNAELQALRLLATGRVD